MKKKYFFLINSLITASLVVIAFSQQGCLYDKPAVVTGCDTAKVTYSGSVKPILVANCIRCHNAPNAVNVAGVILDDYAFVIRQVPQPLLDAINHTGSVTPMPKDGGKLDDCSIAKITIWIREGAKDN